MNHPHASRKTAALLEGLILPLLFFVSLWLILPSVNGVIWTQVLGSVLLLGTLLLLYRSKANWPSVCQRYYFSSKDVPLDALILLSPLVVGFALAGGIEFQLDTGRVASSLFIYPFYALLQLSIFLVIPAIRMNSLAYSSHSICLICALIFSLVHYPNPLLMIFTGLAMLALCGQFLRGRSVLVLALIMGIAATGFKLAVPQEWALEMRIGPDYMEKRAALEVQN